MSDDVAEVVELRRRADPQTPYGRWRPTPLASEANPATVERILAAFSETERLDLETLARVAPEARWVDLVAARAALSPPCG